MRWWLRRARRRRQATGSAWGWGQTNERRVWHAIGLRSSRGPDFVPRSLVAEGVSLVGKSGHPNSRVSCPLLTRTRVPLIDPTGNVACLKKDQRSEEHTSELQSL